MKELRLSYRKYGRIAEAAKENPQLAEVLKKDLELGKAQNELLKKIKAATNDNEKKELTQKLEEALGRRFDLIMERKQIEYEHLRKKLERLKEEVQQSEGQVEKWKQLKGNLVKERLDKLLKQSEEFTWD
jgi:glycerophosphoryl diester phosphodiesterase